MHKKWWTESSRCDFQRKKKTEGWKGSYQHPFRGKKWSRKRSYIAWFVTEEIQISDVCKIASANLKYDMPQLPLLSLPHSNLHFRVLFLNFYLCFSCKVQTLFTQPEETELNWTELDSAAAVSRRSPYRHEGQSQIGFLPVWQRQPAKETLLCEKKTEMPVKYTDKKKHRGFTKKEKRKNTGNLIFLFWEKNTSSVTQVKADMSQGH